MSATHVRCGIEDLVVRIQADFLDDAVAGSQTAGRAGAIQRGRDHLRGRARCLTEARVLERSRQGVYMRHYPEAQPRRATAAVKRTARHAA